MLMEAVVYSTFRNHLKDYMKKVNDEFEPLAVVNKNPDEDIVVVSKSEWDSIQETLRIVQNKELSDKVLRLSSASVNPFFISVLASSMVCFLLVSSSFSTVVSVDKK